MRVYFNLTPLGGSFKTGIYRVAHHLVKGVAEKLGSDVTVIPLNNAYGSVMYYERNLSATGARLILSKRVRQLLPFTRELDHFVLNSGANRSLVFRAARKIAWLVSSWVDNAASKLPDGTINSSNIYHSPFVRIPRQIREDSKFVRFTTIYDLIPITNPEYFEESTIYLLRNIIGSLVETDYVVCISEATRRALLENSKCSPSRAFVVPLAASDSFYPFQSESHSKTILSRHGIRSDGYILSLCTLEIRKNLEAVIQAFRMLHERKAIPPLTQLVLVGGGGWKSKGIVEALREADAVRDLIVLPGFIPDEDLAAIYTSARVFVYMSLLEGFGLPPLEAMKCGTPVITSNTSSLPEVVGNAGVMHAPKDVEALCSSLIRFYNDNAYHAEMSQKAVERAAEFSWVKFVDANIEAYNFALKEHA